MGKNVLISVIIVVIIVIIIVIIVVNNNSSNNLPIVGSIFKCKDVLKPPRDVRAKIVKVDDPTTPIRTYVMWTNIPGTTGVNLKVVDDNNQTHTYDLDFPNAIDTLQMLEINTKYDLYKPPIDLERKPIAVQVTLKNKCGLSEFSALTNFQ